MLSSLLIGSLCANSCKMKFPILLLLCCAGATVAEATSQWNSIYITPSNGSNAPGCGNLTSPCRNLTYALQLSLRKNSTMYVLSPGTHYLDNTTYLHPFSLDGLGIRGNGGQSFVECVGPNAGLSFVGTSNVLLENVTFSHCAALQNSTSRNFSTPLKPLRMYQFYAGLYFYLCKDISMNRVEVTNSPNATGVAMFDTTGTVVITQSNFTNNRLDESNHNFPGGGGVYVEFSYCVPEERHCTSPPKSGTSNSSYKFEGCTFTNNCNKYIPGKYYVFFSLPRGTFHDAFGRGGGLSIFFKGNATENTFEISNCQFSDNTAVYGGGLAMSILDNATKNTVKMEGCSFDSNTCNVTGGGIDIFYAVVENKGSNVIAVLSTDFTNNTARNGGAFSLLVTSQNSSNDQVATLSLGKCSFENNRAIVGSAVYLAKYLLFLTENTPTVEISSSEFTGNQILRSTDVTYIHREGIAVVYVDKVPIRFRHKVHFSDNKGSALGVVGAHVDFRECSATFVRNTGFQGGAIALLGEAWILFNNATSMNFTSNWAFANGGAIYNKYIEREDLRDFSRCFLNYDDLFVHPDDWNATFFFWNNSAGIHGNGIYSTSIFPCAKGSVGDASPNNASGIFCWRNWKWENCSCESQLGTDVGKITFTGDLVKTFPGKVFFLPIEVYDDLGHEITKETVFATTTKNTSSVTVDSQYQYVSHGSVKLLGVGNATLEVDTVSNREWQINIKVELQPCPPGLVLATTGDGSSCVCSGNYGGKVKCDNKQFTASLTSGYWMGGSPNNQSILVLGLCYTGFCSLATEGENLQRLPNSTADLDMHICSQQNRTGVMCGKCLKHNGPAVNTDTHQCVYCKDVNTTASILYYVVLVYIPLFLLFMVIVLCNVRLTSGPANAFILYSQVIASSFSVDEGSYICSNTFAKVLIQGYKALCGVFNLEFIEKFVQPLCLGTNLNTLDVLQLHYAVALFPLLMIVLVILCVRMKPLIIISKLVQNCCKPSKLTTFAGRFLHQRRLGQSLLHAFAAFILLSYTKFTLSSTYILNYQYLVRENGSTIDPPRPVFAGHYTINDREYKVRYLLPAVIVFATFVAVPPLLLLHYPVHLLELCINRVHCLRRLYPVDKVHILLDTFQGCYKNNMRFFAGLYFIFRLAINASYILTPQLLPRYCFQQITCTVYVLLVALCQPYTRKFLNYVDILIFTNLAIVNTLSTLMYASDGQFQLASFAFQCILVFLPLVYMIVYIVWCLMSPRLEKIKTCMKTCTKRIRHDVSIAGSEEDRETSEAPYSDMEALWKRAKRGNTYRAPAREQVDGENGFRVQPPSPDVELQYPGSVGEVNSESKPLASQGELESYGTFEGT